MLRRRVSPPAAVALQVRWCTERKGFGQRPTGDSASSIPKPAPGEAPSTFSESDPPSARRRVRDPRTPGQDERTSTFSDRAAKGTATGKTMHRSDARGPENFWDDVAGGPGPDFPKAKLQPGQTTVANDPDAWRHLTRNILEEQIKSARHTVSGKAESNPDSSSDGSAKKDTNTTPKRGTTVVDEFGQEKHHPFRAADGGSQNFRPMEEAPDFADPSVKPRPVGSTKVEFDKWRQRRDLEAQSLQDEPLDTERRLIAAWSFVCLTGFIWMNFRDTNDAPWGQERDAVPVRRASRETLDRGHFYTEQAFINNPEPEEWDGVTVPRRLETERPAVDVFYIPSNPNSLGESPATGNMKKNRPSFWETFVPGTPEYSNVGGNRAI